MSNEEQGTHYALLTSSEYLPISSLYRLEEAFFSYFSDAPFEMPFPEEEELYDQRSYFHFVSEHTEAVCQFDYCGEGGTYMVILASEESSVESFAHDLKRIDDQLYHEEVYSAFAHVSPPRRKL